MEYKGYDFRIRKLTPKGCWRLMGWGKKTYGVWDDIEFNKAYAVNSNTQLYKQAGNGIAIPVVEHMARQMYKEGTEINMIEMFGGIGCQRKGFENAGIKVNSAMYCDFDKYAVRSYNAIFDENYEPTDIRDIKGEDLPIEDGIETVLVYSFPCTDLSVAGSQKMMSRDDYLNGNGTRSGLLWEVERILKERADAGLKLPDVLLMENVIQVHSKKNAESFSYWMEFLDSLGYHSTWKDLNAKDYGLAQNRNRTFMYSTLYENDWFRWPDPIPLETCMADYLDEVVDEKFYINSEKSDDLIRKLIDSGELDAYV